MFEDQDYPWERQAGEPSKWFARFDSYYLPLGADRTLEAAYRAWRADQPQKGAELSTVKQKRPSQVWYRVFADWGWRLRAEAWDKAERKKRLEQEEKERLEWQEKRRQLMTGFFAKLAQALSMINFEDPRLSEISGAVKMILDQNRLEYGLPTEISQVNTVYEVEWKETNDS